MGELLASLGLSFPAARQLGSPDIRSSRHTNQGPTDTALSAVRLGILPPEAPRAQPHWLPLSPALAWGGTTSSSPSAPSARGPGPQELL